MIHCIYHGHSFVEILFDHNKSILIDPFITWNPKCDISLDDIWKKNIIAICITHGHGDHIGDTIAIKWLFADIPVFTVTWVAHYLEQQSLVHIYWWSIGGTLHHADFSIKLVTAIHDGNILETGISTQPSGMILKLQWKTIYHLGDTALTKDFELIGEFEKIDLAFVPIGDYYTMWIGDSVIATAFIKPKIVVPIHYNTRQNIQADELDRASQVMKNNIATPKVLHPGQYIVL